MKTFLLLRGVVSLMLLCSVDIDHRDPTQATIPDLVPFVRPGFGGSFGVNPLHSGVGGIIKINGLIVRNAGETPAGPFTTAVYASVDNVIGNTDDIKLWESVVDGVTTIRQFSPVTVTLPATMTPRIYHMGAIIDVGNTVIESNETNNIVTMSGTFEVLAAVNADLKLDNENDDEVGIGTGDAYAIDYGPSGALSLAKRAPITFVTRVRNTGVAVNRPFRIGYYISTDAEVTTSDRFIGSRDIPFVGANTTSLQTHTEKQLPELPAGTYTVGIIVDDLNQVLENSGGRESNNVLKRQVIIRGDIPEDTHPVWRMQIKLFTADVHDAKTDDPVHVIINQTTKTVLDYPQDDFERNKSYTYDLLLDGISTYGDIGQIVIAKDGTNGWCLDRWELYINEKIVFSHNYEGCLWIDPWSNDAYFSYTRLRANTLWATDTPDFPFEIRDDFILGMVKSVVGTMIYWELEGRDLYWGCYHDEPVKLTRIDNNTVKIDLDLCSNITGPDPEIDIDFHLNFDCDCEDGYSITTSHEHGRADFFLGSKLFSDQLKENMDAFEKRIDTGGFGCIPTEIDDSGNVTPDLNALYDDLSIDVALDRSVSPGAQVEVTYTITNEGNDNPGDFRVVTSFGSVSGEGTTTDVLDETELDDMESCKNSRRTFTRTIAIPADLECNMRMQRSVSNVPRKLERIAGTPEYYLSFEVITSHDRNLDDNIKTVAIGVTLPDLTVTGAALQSSVNVTSRFTYRYTIANQGGQPSGLYDLRIGMTRKGDGARFTLLNQRMGTLAAGRYLLNRDVTLSLPADITVGEYFIHATVLPRNDMECDAANNTVRSNITVVRLPVP